MSAYLRSSKVDDLGGAFADGYVDTVAAPTRALLTVLGWPRPAHTGPTCTACGLDPTDSGYVWPCGMVVRERRAGSLTALYREATGEVLWLESSLIP